MESDQVGANLPTCRRSSPPSSPQAVSTQPQTPPSPLTLQELTRSPSLCPSPVLRAPPPPNLHSFSSRWPGRASEEVNLSPATSGATFYGPQHPQDRAPVRSQRPHCWLCSLRGTTPQCHPLFQEPGGFPGSGLGTRTVSDGCSTTPPRPGPPERRDWLSTHWA